MDRRLITVLFAGATLILVAQPVSGVDLELRSGDVMGVDFVLLASGVGPQSAAAGHLFRWTPGVIRGSAQSRAQLSGDVLSIFSYGPSFSVNVPASPSIQPPGVFWVDGSSEGNGTYDGFVRTNSGFSPPPVVPANWIIDVLPTAGEQPGTPTQIDIHATFNALLTASGNSSAQASWFASTNHGTIFDGSVAQTGEGSQTIFNLSDTSFLVPIGGSFELEYRYELQVSGAGNAMSRAEITESVIGVTATVVPEPSTLVLAVFGMASAYCRRRRTRR